MATVKLNASAIGGTIVLSNTGQVIVPADGVITVDTRDVPFLLARGATFISAATRYFEVPIAPRAASAGRLVASTALTNGTKTIANQPDVPRQGILVIDPGTLAITAGTVSIPYTANDGTLTTDVISCVTPASTILSVTTTKGILILAAPVVAGVVGGASPGVQVNDSNSLSVPFDAGAVDFTAVQTLVDGAAVGNSAVASSAASVTPSTVPNGTHTYGVYYSVNQPNV